MPRERDEKLVASNRKARHDYHILDVYEAGIVLTGTEVKSLRAGRASLIDGWVLVVELLADRSSRVISIQGFVSKPVPFTQIDYEHVALRYWGRASYRQTLSYK